MISKKVLKEFFFDVFDVVTFLVFVGWIVLFIRFFVFNPYTVVGQSMEPTYHEKDFIIVDKITTRFGELKRWDVIVFVPPGKDIPYIKRIIWLPGEVVKVSWGKVQVCKQWEQEKCEVLEETYLPSDSVTEARCGVTEFVVTTGYFVMGDNRWHSTDSRCWFGLWFYGNSTGYTATMDRIIGKVSVKLFPF